MSQTVELPYPRSRRRRLVALIRSGALALALASPAWAGGNVNVCTEEELLAAVKNGGLVEFACSGTIALTEPVVIDLDTTLDAGTNSVVLTPQLTNRLFVVPAGRHLTLQGLTLRGGRVLGSTGTDGAPGESGRGGESVYGGAVLNDGGTLTAMDTRFESNTAQGGNGGRGGDGIAVQTRGREGGRGGNGGGGAIHNGSRTELLRCVFEDNAAFGGGGGFGGNGSTNFSLALGGDGGDGGWGRGGALYNAPGSSLQIEDCTFARSTAGGEIGGSGGLGVSGRSFPAESGTAGPGSGGALFGDGSTLAISATTFHDNFTGGAGGWSGLAGLEARSGQDAFSGAEAQGGAISVSGGQASLTNCTFFANGVVGGDGGIGGAGGSADLGAGGGDGGNGGNGIGGALWTGDGAEVLLVNCTLSLNRAVGGEGGAGGAPGASLHDRGDPGQPGRGLGGAVANSAATLTLINTILDTSAPEGNAYGTITDAGHNLSSDGSAVFTAVTSANDVDPRVAWLADNGGSTLTAALKPDSPAIDHGDDTPSPPTDQRGQARVGTADIGAFEFDPAAATPTLDIRTEGDQLTLTWPATLRGWRLQSSEDPAAGEWIDVDDVQLEGPFYTYTTDLSLNESLYFRLTR